MSPMSRRVCMFLLITGHLLGWSAAHAQRFGGVVEAEVLEARIETVKDAVALDENARNRLLDLYQQSLANLDSIAADEQAIAEFQAAAGGAPAQIERIRARLDGWAAAGPVTELDVSPAASSVDLSRLLEEELTNEAAVGAKFTILDARLEEEVQRPAASRQQIAAARAEVRELVSLDDTRLVDQDPQLTQAIGWANSSRLDALQARIIRLDQELLTYDPRFELLQFQRDEQAAGLARISQRVSLLREAAVERRRQETDDAMAEAQASIAGAIGDRPLLRELAEGNQALVGLLTEQLTQVENVAVRQRERPRVAAVDAAFRSARRKLDLEGRGGGAAIGLAVLEQRRKFPQAQSYRIQRRQLARTLSAVSLRRLEAEEEQAALQDVEAYLDRRLADSGIDALGSDERAELTGLIETRRILLGRLVAIDISLRSRLLDLDDALQRLAARTDAYDAFLAERMLWVRTTRGLGGEALPELATELARFLSPVAWVDTARQLGLRLLRAPVFLLPVLWAVVLFVRRGRYLAAITEAGKPVGRIQEDRLSHTLKALTYSVLLAVPVPLLLASFGAALVTAPDVGVFPKGVGEALLTAATWMSFPWLLMALFRRGGLADSHFRVEGDVLVPLRRQLKILVGFGVPLLFLVVATNVTDASTGIFGGVLTTLCFTALLLLVLLVALKVAHPTLGALAPALARQPDSPWWRWRYVWFPAILILLGALVVLSVLGFDYTTQQMTRRIFQSAWLVIVVWLGISLLRRWLQLTSRRLAYEKAMRVMESASEPGAATESAALSAEEGAIGESEIDLEAMDADTRKLLNASALLVAAIGLVGIWSDVLPALAAFEEVNLWNRTALVDGVQQLVPVTLNDVFLAILIGAGGYLLAVNLPSLVNIILLKQGTVSAGGRYTIKTLINYAIIGATVLMVLGFLGFSTAQLGFVAAALGVGIGFGLQEIVANFICGLILLFERPVRVGDTVTIGDASGVVSKIRIRATTLRDWEQKELVIPNKELITGRLVELDANRLGNAVADSRRYRLRQ